MTDPKKVLQIADQYRKNLEQATDKEAIRQQQAWYAKKAAPLFKK